MAAKAKREFERGMRWRDEVIKCVSQMEMDAALQTEQLKAAISNLSYPSFVFEKGEKDFFLR